MKLCGRALATMLLATGVAVAQPAPPPPAEKKPHDLTGLIRQRFSRRSSAAAASPLPAMLPPSIPEANTTPDVQAELEFPVSEEASQMEELAPKPMPMPPAPMQPMTETPVLPPPTVLQPDATEPRGNPVESSGQEYIITDPMMPLEPAPAIPRWWGRAEYLILQTPDPDLPVPLASSNTTGLTATYFQGGQLDYGNYTGGRFELGRWMGDQRRWAFTLGTFFADSRGVEFAADSSSLSAVGILLPIVRPTLDPVTNAGAFMQFGPIDLSTTGLMTISSDSRMWGSEMNFIRPMASGPGYRISLLAGARYLDLKENLDVATSVTPTDSRSAVYLGSFVPVGDAGYAWDFFDTRNQFAGGTIGARFDYQLDQLVISFLGRAAIGGSHQKVNIQGMSALNGVNVPGGFLAQTTNIGSQSETNFAVIPEFNFQLSYLFRRVRFFGGYNLMFWNVVRPGSQIDPGINLNRVPLTVVTDGITITYDPTSGPARPFQRFQRENIWIQGINLGLELVF